MDVVLADKAGFCFGVRRAVGMAEKAASEHRTIHSLGPLIHNRQVVERLMAGGVLICDDIDDLPAGEVIIPSHGVTIGEQNRLREKGHRIIDATCPFVRYPQELCRELSRRNHFVVIVGDPGHKEVLSVQSYAEGPSAVVPSFDRLPDMRGTAKAALIAQTTQSQRNFSEVAAALVARVREVLCVNTICNATAERQAAAVDLAGRVDAVVVVGGHDSANTNRLEELCRQRLPGTHHVEAAGELAPEWFEGCGSVGVTAGASTPDWVIEEVVGKIKSLDNS